MAKREVIGLHEAWQVWLDGCVTRVETEAEAKALLLANGKEYGNPGQSGSNDYACSRIEILWNTPLPFGQSFHKYVLSPVTMVVHHGQLRNYIQALSPSEFARSAKAWLALEPKLPAWWPRQYQAGLEDPEVLVLRGKQSIKVQLDTRWSTEA